MEWQVKKTTRKVHVAVEFHVPAGVDFAAEEALVVDALFVREGQAIGASDVGSFSDETKRLVVLTAFGEGQNVDQAAAAAVTLITTTVESSNTIEWQWRATHVESAEAQVEDRLLSA
jgi:hypothetical protein